MDGLGAEWAAEPLWGCARMFGDGEAPAAATPRRAEGQSALPDWLRRAAPEEARPPRPLAPSALGDEDVADPPPSAAARDSARRGKWLHSLFERLPEVPEAERAARADRWLDRSAGIADPGLRAELVEAACRIVADPRHAALFGAGGLAEAPIAAVVGEGLVVSGTVDRLVIDADRILFADFKTGRRVPATLADIPVPHLRQMAAYAEALKIIFPGRRIEAKLLYTAEPLLHDLPAELIAAHIPEAGVVETDRPMTYIGINSSGD
jgi:ATP-dependent helicase/nuclease subunit A